MRMFVTILSVLLILAGSVFMGELCEYILKAIGLPSWVCFWLGLIVEIFLFIYLTYRFLKDAIREIPADPPHKAILLFLGKRRDKILDEGWRLLPFYQIIFDVIAIDITKNNEDLPPQIVKTPDLADLSFEVSITWSAGGYWDKEKERQIELLNNYIMSEKEPGVKKIYKDIIQNRLRIWAFSKQEGPSNWQEAIGSRDEAIATLIKAILGDDIPSIPSDVPTNILLRYFSVPRQGLLEYQGQEWGKQTEQGSEWEGLETQLGRLSSDELKNLKKAVEERRKIITALKRGNGFSVLEKLGITIHLLTINNVALTGDVAEAVQKRVKEEEEAIAETTEIDHLLNMIEKLNKEGKIPRELAAELVQIERGKVTKHVEEKKWSASTDLTRVAKKLAGVKR